MKKRVLVVDDNLNNLLLEKDLLEFSGFEVLIAIDATSGIEMAKTHLPDVIVMDVRLPDMRGSQAAKILRNRIATRNIPIVFVTASVMAEGLKELEDISATGFIGKPIDTRTFATEIARFVR